MAKAVKQTREFWGVLLNYGSYERIAQREGPVPALFTRSKQARDFMASIKGGREKRIAKLTVMIHEMPAE